MTEKTPRVRMFAGPNGSGKSVLKSYLPEHLLGIYLNADEIEVSIRQSGVLDLRIFDVKCPKAELQDFFLNHNLLLNHPDSCFPERLLFEDDWIDFGNVVVNAYYASSVVSLLRTKLLEMKRTFTFETVMSHPAKVAFLQEAQRVGYRTYLYFIATDDPAINVSRVRNRVRLGGHSVPESKIVERYDRSLNLLFDAIQFTHRAYIFDNSRSNPNQLNTWLAEITNGVDLELKTFSMPNWFGKAILDKLAKEN